MSQSMITIGELAKRAGVTPKALRIYEKKGMIQAWRNEENNYRLYEEDCLITLQQIQLLKFLGFSLDHIKEFLTHFDEIRLEDAFLEQKAMLEKKQSELGTMIACMERAAVESRNRQLNIHALTNSLNSIILNQKADDWVRELSKYSDEPRGWSRWIYDITKLGAKKKVLDAGAGWGNLWRYNIDRIPEDLTLHCIDQHNTHADAFADYVKELEETNAGWKGKVKFTWADMENIPLEDSYDQIYFNHVSRFIKNRPVQYQKFKNALKKNGTFVATWGGELIQEKILELFSQFAPNEVAEWREACENHMHPWHMMEQELHQVFTKVTKHTYCIILRFDTLKEYTDFVIRSTKGYLPELNERRVQLMKFLEKQKNGDHWEIERDTNLYICQ